MTQGYVAQIIDGIEFSFAVDDVIPDIATTSKSVGGKSVSEGTRERKGKGKEE